MDYIIAGIRIAIPTEFAAGPFARALAPFAAPDRGSADLKVETGQRIGQTEGYRELDAFDFVDADADCRFGCDEQGYLLTMTPRDGSSPARFRTAYGATTTLSDITPEHTPALFRFGVWLMFNIAAVARQAVAIHSSVICRDGCAVLFLGESGTGKSTHTRLWREHIPGAELLNDDSPVVRIIPRGASTAAEKPAASIAATPAGAQISGEISTQAPQTISPDVLEREGQEQEIAANTNKDFAANPVENSAVSPAFAREQFATPASATQSTENPVENTAPDRPRVMAFGSPWSGKTPCYRNLSYPIRAIVRLSQAPHNSIRRLRPIEAIGALLPSCPPSFAYDQTLNDALCRIISDVVAEVPVYHLACLPDAAAAELAFETLFGE